MKKSKLVSGLLITALCIPAFGNYDLPVRAKEQEETKSYIIVAEDETAYEATAEEVIDDRITETELLSENHIIVAELTEDEAEILENDEGVFVEDDIILSGSTFAEGGNDLGETTFEEARKRKVEMKRMKRERLAAMELEEEASEADADPEYEWNIQAVHAEEAIENSDKSTQNIKVAVLDSGVDYSTGINQKGYVNFIEGEEELSPIFQDGNGHGTGIASIIAGNGETGIYGISPDVDLYSVKVLDDENKAPLSRVIQGIYWCIENDMDIINMSFGTSAYSRAFEQAVQDAYQAGILMVGAAGNGSGSVEYPAAFPEVMAVASVNPEAEISEFSNTGEELEIAAPGEKIRVASFFEGNIVTHGTSIAVPHVTGTAALLWAKDKSKSNEFIRQLIQYSAKDIEGTDECGLLDTAYAMNIYDEFAEQYDENQEMAGESIPENTQVPESFEDVADDEIYVEGRWHRDNHAAAVPNSVSGFTYEEIQIIKAGIQYPDLKESWKDSKIRPWWHGRWKPSDKGNLVNYIAVFEMLTEVALEGGKFQNYMTCNWFDGMDKETYKVLKTNIQNISVNEYNTLLPKNTEKNRKCFLFGCALHSATDIFAHSTAELNGTRIHHTVNGEKRADNVKYHGRRYDMAVQLAKYALQELKENTMCNGYDVMRAIKSQYEEGKMKFKIINIKSYLIANKCEPDSIIEKMDCYKP